MHLGRRPDVLREQGLQRSDDEQRRADRDLVPVAPPPDQCRDEDEQLERDDDPADGDVRVEDTRVAEDLLASR
jgi:hypothetical protein